RGPPRPPPSICSLNQIPRRALATQIVLVLDHLLQSSSASRVTAGARTPAQMVTPARRHRRGSVCLAFASDRGVSRPLTQVLARGRHRRQARPTFFASESIPCNAASRLGSPEYRDRALSIIRWLMSEE